MLPIGRLFELAFGRVKNSFFSFLLLGLLALLAVLACMVLTLGLGFGALTAFHGADFSRRLVNPSYLLMFLNQPENQRLMWGLAAVAGFLSLRSLGIFLLAATHVAGEPGLGTFKALRLANARSLGFLALFLLTLMAVQLGSALILAPGIFLAVKLSLAGAAYARGEGLIQSIKTSWRLSGGCFWELLLRLLVLGLVAGLLLLIPVLGWAAGAALWLAAVDLMLEELLGPAPKAEAQPAETGERRGEPREGLSPFGALDRPAAVEATAPEAELEPAEDLGAVLNDSWKLFAARFKELSLIGLACLAALLLAALLLAALLCLGAGWGWVRARPDQAIPAALTLSLIGLTALGWILAWGSLALLRAVYSPENESAGAHLKAALGGSWRMSASMGLAGLLVCGGWLLFGLPGLLFSVWFSFAPMAVALEGAGALESLALSRRAVKGKFWKAAGWLFVLGLVAGAAGSVPVLGHVFGLVLFAVAYESLRRSNQDLPAAGAGVRAAWVACGLLGLLWLPLFLAATGRLNLDEVKNLSTRLSGREPLPENIAIPPHPWSAVWLSGARELKAIDGDGQGNYYGLDLMEREVIRLDATGAVLGRFKDRAGRMTDPKDLAVDEAGSVFVACGSEHHTRVLESGERRSGFNLILKFDKDGNLLLEIPGPGGASNEIASDKAGSLYLLDEGGSQALKLSAADGSLQMAMPLPDYNGFNPFYGLGFAAAAGRVFVAEMGSENIRVLDSSSGALLANLRAAPELGAFRPCSLAPDGQGGVWMVNGANWSILHLDSTGQVLEEMKWESGPGGPMMGEFADLYLDPSGTLFACEVFYGRLVSRPTAPAAGP